MLIAHLRKGLAVFVSCALVMVGSLIWVDNSLAVIPDGDPTTFVQLDLIDGAEDQGPSDHQLYGAEKTGRAQAGALFVRGNGDRDDNREKAVSLGRLAGRCLPLAPARAITNFGERRTVAAYKDFGHLRVMPAGNTVFYCLFPLREKAVRFAEPSLFVWWKPLKLGGWMANNTW